jgi:magnesium-transporting ATPase (P-type)
MSAETGQNGNDTVKGDDAVQALSSPAHSLGAEDVIKELYSEAEQGLRPDEAKNRLAKYGNNELESGGGVQPLKILLRQVSNARMLVSSTMPFQPPVH